MVKVHAPSITRDTVPEYVADVVDSPVEAFTSLAFLN